MRLVIKEDGNVETKKVNVKVAPKITNPSFAAEKSKPEANANVQFVQHKHVPMPAFQKKIQNAMESIDVFFTAAAAVSETIPKEIATKVIEAEKALEEIKTFTSPNDPEIDYIDYRNFDESKWQDPKISSLKSLEEAEDSKWDSTKRQVNLDKFKKLLPFAIEAGKKLQAALKPDADGEVKQNIGVFVTNLESIAQAATTLKESFKLTLKEVRELAIEELMEELDTASLDNHYPVCEGCLFEHLESLQEGVLEEAKYHGKSVPLGKPMRGDVKKFKVFVRDPKSGNVKKVNFGDKKMRIKKSNPKRRKSFRARHHCENPGPRTKARYWSCRKW